MKTTFGTNHFVSFAMACAYYKTQGFDRVDVQKKLEEKEIEIGAPEVTENQTRFVDNDGRYHIQQTK